MELLATIAALGIFCEDDEAELHRRQASINRKLGVDFADLENMRWVSRVGADNFLMTIAGDGRAEHSPFLEQIVSTAKEIGAQLVVIDTAADTFGGNENVRPHVRQFISVLNRLAIAIDGAVLLLAHPSQAGKANGSGDGGSTAWNNSVRSRHYLSRKAGEKNQDDDLDLRTLGRLKANYAKIGETITLRWSDGAFEVDGPRQGWSLERSQQANDAFLAGLAELNAIRTRCNIHKGQRNFAPRAILDLTKAAEGFDQRELEAAMNRLLRDRRIASIEEGPASRPRSRLVIVSPEFPNLGPQITDAIPCPVGGGSGASLAGCDQRNG